MIDKDVELSKKEFFAEIAPLLDSLMVSFCSFRSNFEEIGLAEPVGTIVANLMLISSAIYIEFGDKK